MFGFCCLVGFFLFPALATARRTDKEPRWNQYIQCSPSAEVIGDAMANGEKNIAGYAPASCQHTFSDHCSQDCASGNAKYRLNGLLRDLRPYDYSDDCYDCYASGNAECRLNGLLRDLRPYDCSHALDISRQQKGMVTNPS